MATGKKQNNAVVNEGASWVDRYDIAIAAANKLECVATLGADGKEKVMAWYNGAGAITLTDYNNFPTGSIIIDMQIGKTHERIAAGWRSSVARA